MLRRKARRIILRFSSAAAETVADNDDLLLEILFRLPIRSLVQFKSVSKRWLSLISDPNFSRRWSNFHPPTPSGIFLRSCPNCPVFDFVDLRQNPPRVPFESPEFSVPEHRIVILQSCNGLLLCCNEGQRYPKSDYYIYNPTTKQYTTLPTLQTKEGEIDRNRAIVGLNLAFDPLRSSNYKIVCVRVLDSSNYEIEIYSPDSGFWRPCNGAFPAPYYARFDSGVYWNGAVYWNNWGNCLYLDLCEEKLHELPCPRASDDCEDGRLEYFGICGGHLHWIESSERQAVLSVYEVEDDRCGWFMKYKVDLHWVSTLFPKVSLAEEGMGFSRFTVLAIVDQCEVDEEPYVVLQSLEKAVRVNVKSGSFERLVYILNDGGTTKFPMGFGEIDAFLYMESLACV